MSVKSVSPYTIGAMFTLKLNSVLVDEDGEKFFGSGPMRLLEGVKRYGSLSASAKAMGMSYSKAYRLISHAEKALGFPLLESHSGGKSGGASFLSQKAEIFLRLYKEYAADNTAFGRRHLDRLVIDEDLQGLKIIVLASGKGVRFEENKLLYELKGRKLVSYILETLSVLKEHCIVSTIHEEVKQIAESLGYETAMHEDESLSASIREGLKKIASPCATMFVQADQPLVTLSSILSLADAWRNDKESFYKLSYHGEAGAPTVFPEAYFEGLKQLKGESGGSALIKKHPETKMQKVEALFPWELWDVDTKEDLKYFEDMIGYLEKEAQ